MTATTATVVQGSPSESDGNGRMIDPRGQRFGAGLSVVLLLVGFAIGLPLVLPFLAVALGLSAFFGTRYSILGRPWPYVRRLLRLEPPAELEHEFPPRFSQALGTIGFGLATVLLLVGLGPIAWIVAAAVGALQAVLAVTGYCLGCRLYFLKWWVPAQFARIARKTTLA